MSKNQQNSAQVAPKSNASCFNAWQDKPDLTLYVLLDNRRTFPKDAQIIFQNDYRLAWFKHARNNIYIDNNQANDLLTWEYAKEDKFDLLMGWGKVHALLPNYDLMFDGDDNEEYKTPVCLSLTEIRNESKNWLNMNQKSVRIISRTKIDKEDQDLILKELKKYRVHSAVIVRHVIDENDPSNNKIVKVADFTTELEMGNKELAQKHGIELTDEEEIAFSGESADAIKTKSKMFDNDDFDSNICDFFRYNTNLLNNYTQTGDRSTLLCWDGKKWDYIEEDDFRSHIHNEGLNNYIEEGFNNSKVRSVSEMCRRDLPKMKETKRNLINFSNLVVEIDADGNITTHPHSKEYGLTTLADYEYIPTVMDTPYFDKWINHASCNSDGEFSKERFDTIMAACYMIITNQYRWQMFLEVLGEGGSGKSIFAEIATALAGGEESTCFMELSALEGQKGKGAFAQIPGTRLMLMAEQPQYFGEAVTLKRTTGNDPLNIPRMGQPDFVLSCYCGIVLITSNQPIAATDKTTALERRRVTIYIDNVVKEEEKIINLGELVKKESPFIFNKVLDYFETPEDARQALCRARQSGDKQKALMKSDPMVNWITDNLEPSNEERCQVGSVMSYNEAMRGFARQRYIKLIECAQTALYPNYRAWCYANDIDKPLALRKFSENLVTKLSQLKSLGYEDCKKITPKNIKTITNVKIKTDACMFDEMRLEIARYD
ncbi:TPA: hypothetical protein VGT17_005203 [Vibrio harveyi]|nr:hypothetical protein [Vibrio harveyi]HEQ3599235.1 hypothetical protein [Vibrio harveyi]HEQ3611293.1 hypothetical protein [Vibrio harveyi]